MRSNAKKSLSASFLFLTVISLLALLLYLHKQRCPPGYFLFFLAADATIFALLLNGNSSRIYRMDFNMGELLEKINLLAEENSRELKTNNALSAKTGRYDQLKKITEELNQCFNVEKAAQVLADEAFKLVSSGRGTCMVFLADSRTQKLGLFRSRKEDEQLVLKAKEGDIFDHWVLRHSSSLIIENIRNDFRFDPDRIQKEDDRAISSLISTPLISNNSVVGLLRLDHPEPGFFSQEDLRFLSLLGDLGAVAIENAQLFQRTQDLAIHDDLTGLYTRTYFTERLKEQSLRCLRLGKPLSLLMVDIDFFKRYNDKFGHTAGDIVLKKLGSLMRRRFEENNSLVFRFGGEEFLVLLPAVNKKGAYEAGDALRRRIAAEKIILRRQETEVTVSVGISTVPEDTRDENELIRLADKAMYNAKQQGRNRVCSA